jgi:hypothetical protein
VLSGYAVENVDYSSVEGVGWTEKRAAADGLHASDVYLGGRRIEMSGFVYGTNLAEYFDFLHTLRSLFSPTSAYLDSPGDRGFLPLEFTQPTNNLTNWPGDPVGPPVLEPGVIPLYISVRPLANVRFNIARDRQSKQGNGPTSSAWQVQLLAKDPRVYVNPPQTVSLVGGPFALTSGTAKNRGDYETPLNILLAVDALPSAAGTFHLTGLNGIDMTITIEKKAKTVYRWFGDDRVLMTEDVTNGPGSAPLVLRMDLVSFATKNRRPSVPAKPFSLAFQYTSTVVPYATGSRLFWSEAFA